MKQSPLRTLLTGCALVESPRWHADRLWFADWGAGTINALDPSTGALEVAARVTS